MIEVLKQALEALERSVATCYDQYAHQQVMSQPNHFINQTITSLRKAIAELESQKPLCTAAMFDDWFLAKSGLDPKTPLYTHQPQRKPLTDDQIYEMYNEPRSDAEMLAFARAIEAAHGIKE